MKHVPRKVAVVAAVAAVSVAPAAVAVVAVVGGAALVVAVVAVRVAVGAPATDSLGRRPPTSVFGGLTRPYPDFHRCSRGCGNERTRLGKTQLSV
ncbi:exported hypothetical protein [Candidatus Accumulibacter aalborgensis]|uniref:Secreted peptide n=1 Tax=Candidatus Accumulibacter aalborgensis TaxID=1860102 RepID=A0A1A8XSA9_9PROT|nr:exported hypothetical protein [Candidatus Accumulibacter aalborgensis]